MLQHAQGNLIDLAEQGEFNVIIHGCNCQNTMGSGIAGELRSRYPEVYGADYVASRQGLNKPGLFSFREVMTADFRKFTVVNAYTQQHYLPRGKDHFEYEHFIPMMEKISFMFPRSRVGIPYIGMGLAGGNKATILNMLDVAAVLFDARGSSLTLVEYA
jgi:O-acetyl-ADP-ribose deacetylase (regulator of RNase III)